MDKRLAEQWNNPEQYAKFGQTRARLAAAGERVETRVDGKLETTNVASDGDVVIVGPKGEEYIVGNLAKFRSRYRGPTPSLEWQWYRPTGKCWAVTWSGEPYSFKASWGEQMIIETGDKLASLSKDGSDPYRIEREVFSQTYRKL